MTERDSMGIGFDVWVCDLLRIFQEVGIPCLLEDGT